MKNPFVIFIVAMVGSCCLLAPSLTAQNVDLSYSSGSTGADGAFTIPPSPSPISNFGFAYDKVRKKAVLFGGQSLVNSSKSNETWEYDAKGWVKRNVVGSPPARSHCMMVYDAERQRIVLFGGLVSTPSVSANDTWIYDGTTWQQVSSPSPPPARHEAAMAYDVARKEVVLTGGSGSSGALKDTWIWNGSAWSEKTPANLPVAGLASMAWYAPLNSLVALGGSAWDGTNWNSVSTDSVNPPEGTLVWDPVRQQLLCVGGVNAGGNPTMYFGSWRHDRGWLNPSPPLPIAINSHEAVWHEDMNQMIITLGYTAGSFRTANVNTLGWDGETWRWKAGANYTFDLNTREDAIWNFTTIDIPAGVSVHFQKNTANHPVLWLASGAVTIAGSINLSGGPGLFGSPVLSGGVGGPGGFDGGTSGITANPAHVLTMHGKGPGGAPPRNPPGAGLAATHATSPSVGVYGTPFAQPLMGGSGGSGAGSASSGIQLGSGGGGGGAILIASSTDITVTGTIGAIGGEGGYAFPTVLNGGPGSGGTVRLVADRVTCTQGTINVGNNGASKGRIRIEALYRNLDDTKLLGTVTKSVPVAGSVLNQAGGRLFVTKVAGATVASPPLGKEINPDVVFSETGSVEVEVEALNIPNGTNVTLKINHSLAGVLEWPTSGQVTLQNGKAVFNGTIPAGSGVLQAFATYGVGGPPPVP